MAILYVGHYYITLLLLIFSHFFKPFFLSLRHHCSILLPYLASQYLKQNTTNQNENSKREKKKVTELTWRLPTTLYHMLHLILLSFMSRWVFCKWAGYRICRGVPCTVSINTLEKHIRKKIDLVAAFRMTNTKLYTWEPSIDPGQVIQ